MNCVVFRFTDRNPANVSNKYLKEIHTGIGPKHDLELIASDQQVVKAHTLVMEMFSEFIRDYLFEFKPTKNPICSKIKPAPKKRHFSRNCCCFPFILFSFIAEYFIVCVAIRGRFDLQW